MTIRQINFPLSLKCLFFCIYTGYNGGIFQVDQIGYLDTKHTSSHPGLVRKFSKIKSAFGIDWAKTSWSDLRKPLYSAIAARLVLANKSPPIPSSLSGQAKYWKQYYNSGLGKGTEQKFINDWNAYLKSTQG